MTIDSTGGIRIVDMNGVTLGEWRPDGTSYHAGLETFAGGISIPTFGGDGAIEIDPVGGIRIVGPGGIIFGEWLPDGTSFHYNTEHFTTIVADLVIAEEKQFRIDHPLDPENKYLHHSSIESSERLNIYSGNTTTDADGFSVIHLPDFFEAVNTDFRYQLTVIGSFAQAIIHQEVSNNQFTIQTDIPSVKVSWQVSGVRHDKYARDNPMQVETLKGK